MSRIIFTIIFLSLNLALADEGPMVRLRRVSDPMKTQREMAVKVQQQNDYVKKNAQLEKIEKHHGQLRADLEFAQIADPDRIKGIRKEIAQDKKQIAKLKNEIAKLHRDLTKSLKRSPASVGPAIKLRRSK